MVGKKGRSGRPKVYDDHPYFVKKRQRDRERYLKNREKTLAYRKEWHKKNLEILKYAYKHKISQTEARKRLKVEDKRRKVSGSD